MNIPEHVINGLVLAGRKFEIRGGRIIIHPLDARSRFLLDPKVRKSQWNRRYREKKKLLFRSLNNLSAWSQGQRKEKQKEENTSSEVIAKVIPPLPGPVTETQAKAEGFTQQTNPYTGSEIDQSMRMNVIVDHWALGTDFRIVINPHDSKETSIWQRKDRRKRYRDIKSNAVKDPTGRTRPQKKKKD